MLLVSQHDDLCPPPHFDGSSPPSAAEVQQRSALLLVLAVRGQPGQALQGIASLERQLAPSLRGPVYAAAARVLWLAAEPQLGSQVLARALACGDATAVGLAAHWPGAAQVSLPLPQIPSPQSLSPQPLSPQSLSPQSLSPQSLSPQPLSVAKYAESNTVRSGPDAAWADAAWADAAWADAACDVVAQLVLNGKRTPARALLHRAQQRCPHHAEAWRWLDHLDANRPLSVDLMPADLLPDRRLGWLSPCRLRRRVGGGLWSVCGQAQRALLPPGSSTGRQRAGLLSAVLEPGASTAAEAAFDRLATRLRWHQPVGRTAAQAWLQARRLGPAQTARAAAWLCRLRARDPNLMRVQRAAQAVLCFAGAPTPGPVSRPPMQTALPLPLRVSAASRGVPAGHRESFPRNPAGHP